MIDVHMPEQPIHVASPDVNVEVAAPNVTVTPPDINVAAPQVNVTTPEIKLDPHINVEAPKSRELESAEVLEREGDHAKLIRTNVGDFEVIERDALGNAKRMKRRTA
jgi:hypothetical protein